MPDSAPATSKADASSNQRTSPSGCISRSTDARAGGVAEGACTATTPCPISTGRLGMTTIGSGPGKAARSMSASTPASIETSTGAPATPAA